MSEVFYDWIRGLAVKYLNLQEPNKTQQVSTQVFQDLSEIISVQEGGIHPFKMRVPQIPVNRLYIVLQYLFGDCGKNPISANYVTRYSSNERNAGTGSYLYEAPLLPFGKEVDMTLEERFVFEILYFLKYGNRPEEADAYCTASPTSETLWWFKIKAPVNGESLLLEGYCYWS